MKTKLSLKQALLKSYHTIEVVEPSYAVALILSTANEILLIERAKREGDHWSGHMAFPGGRHEQNDSDLLQTAIRETFEEVGIHLQPKDNLGGLLDLQLRKRGLPVPGTLASFVFTYEGSSSFDLDHAEVEGAYWIPISYFADPTHMDIYPLQRDNVRVELPCVNYQGKKIWGLTYELLSHFFRSYSEAYGGDYSHLRSML